MVPFCVLTFLMLGLMAILPADLAIGAAAAAGRRDRTSSQAENSAVSCGGLQIISKG